MAEKHHIEMVHDALGAIDQVHQDTSVEPTDTLDSLKELRDHIEFLIDAVEADLSK